ncbi:TATA element modulatory factor [Platysternon megacephalum]|uniref:TATA element modulatory factor n=1 Tax=Platysternon megacephalum TaxID=55544 RepID=A0A4D9EN20_9SAUR|nr:TATA element modulatory factor [Platysternon megacephalum]
MTQQSSGSVQKTGTAPAESVWLIPSPGCTVAHRREGDRHKPCPSSSLPRYALAALLRPVTPREYLELGIICLPLPGSVSPVWAPVRAAGALPGWAPVWLSRAGRCFFPGTPLAAGAEGARVGGSP